MNEFFNQLVKLVEGAGLDPASYRLIEMTDVPEYAPEYKNYPAMWYYYSLVGMTPKEALLTEYPDLKNMF